VLFSQPPLYVYTVGKTLSGTAGHKSPKLIGIIQWDLCMQPRVAEKLLFIYNLLPFVSVGQLWQMSLGQWLLKVS